MVKSCRESISIDRAEYVSVHRILIGDEVGRTTKAENKYNQQNVDVDTIGAREVGGVCMCMSHLVRCETVNKKDQYLVVCRIQ